MSSVLFLCKKKKIGDILYFPIPLGIRLYFLEYNLHVPLWFIVLQMHTVTYRTVLFSQKIP